MKRFYKLVSSQSYNGGYAVFLDGRPVKTKSGKILLALSQDIADAVVLEWAGQKEHIDPNSMPLTQILNTMMDRVAVERAEMTAYLCKYLDTDMLCYRTPDGGELSRRQDGLWQVWLDWFAEYYGCSLEITTGLKAIVQDRQAHEAVHADIKKMSDEIFTVLQAVTALSGSLVLGLAFVHGAADAAQVFKCAFLEEDYKDTLYDAERYGQDPVQEKKQKSARLDLEACEFFLNALKS